VIRVFSVPDATLLYQFRRGTYPTTIHSLSFNLQSTLLSASSESDTVHLFKLEQQNSLFVTLSFFFSVSAAVYLFF